MIPGTDPIWSMCTTNIPSWSNVPPEAVTSCRLIGMSNTVMAVFINDPVLIAQGINPSKVLLRVFPVKPNRTTDRKREQAIFNYLSNSNKGVKLIYSCPEYRIEEFFDGGKLLVEELHDKKLMKNIAEVLCEYNRDQRLFEILTEHCSKVPFGESVLEKWLSIVKDEFETYERYVHREEGRKILKKLKYITTPEFEKEYRELLKGLAKSEVVASHCDIHEMNMLRSNDKKKLLLIDYEYATPNYRAIDIVTLLMETTIDYTFPSFPYFTQDEKIRWSHEELAFFVRCYLEREALLKGEPNLQEYAEAEAPNLIYEIKKAEPLVSAMWTIWSLLITNWQNFDETKDWNLMYAELRFDMFEKTKDSAMKLN